MQSQEPESGLCRGAPDRGLGGLGRAAAAEPQQHGLQLLGARGDFVGRPSRAHGSAGGRQHMGGGHREVALGARHGQLDFIHAQQLRHLFIGQGAAELLRASVSF